MDIKSEIPDFEGLIDDDVLERFKNSSVFYSDIINAQLIKTNKKLIELKGCIGKAISRCGEGWEILAPEDVQLINGGGWEPVSFHLDVENQVYILLLRK